MTSDLIPYRDAREAERGIRHAIFNGFARAATSGGVVVHDELQILSADNPGDMDLSDVRLVPATVERIVGDVALVRAGGDDLRGIWI